MKGVTEFTIAVVIGVLLLIFTVFIFVRGFDFSESGFDASGSSDTLEIPTCPDCSADPSGSKCISYYDEGTYVIPFCGCYTGDDCQSTDTITRVGECSENNKCE